MNEIPKIFIINLEKSSNRRHFMCNQFDTLDIPFQFVKATLGKTLTTEEKRMFSTFNTFKNMGRDLHPNEKGCYLSHYYVWKKMVDENIDEAIIMEDDITISGDFKSIIKNRKQWLPDNWGILNFAWDTHGDYDFQSSQPILNHIDYSLIEFRYLQSVMRSGSYMLNLEAAKVLINKSKPIRYVVDTLTGTQHIHQLPIHGVIPRLGVWNDDIVSDIIDDRTIWVSKSRWSLKGICFRALIKLQGVITK